jgi:formaldehyde-activating enzyme involved in methanogenesis
MLLIIVLVGRHTLDHEHQFIVLQGPRNQAVARTVMDHSPVEIFQNEGIPAGWLDVWKGHKDRA